MGRKDLRKREPNVNESDALSTVCRTARRVPVIRRPQACYRLQLLSRCSNVVARGRHPSPGEFEARGDAVLSRPFNCGPLPSNPRAISLPPSLTHPSYLFNPIQCLRPYNLRRIRVWYAPSIHKSIYARGTAQPSEIK